MKGWEAAMSTWPLGREWEERSLAKLPRGECGYGGLGQASVGVFRSPSEAAVRDFPCLPGAGLPSPLALFHHWLGARGRVVDSKAAAWASVAYAQKSEARSHYCHEHHLCFERLSTTDSLILDTSRAQLWAWSWRLQPSHQLQFDGLAWHSSLKLEIATFSEYPKANCQDISSLFHLQFFFFFDSKDLGFFSLHRIYCTNFAWCSKPSY